MSPGSDPLLRGWRRASRSLQVRLSLNWWKAAKYGNSFYISLPWNEKYVRGNCWTEGDPRFHRRIPNVGRDGDGIWDLALCYWLLNVPPSPRWDRSTQTLCPSLVLTVMDKLTVISGCLFLAADIFAIASIANPDWISTGDSAGSLTVGLVQQCQTIHGRDRICIPPQLPPEWITTLFFIILGIISLTVTCGLLVMSRWRREAARYARWIAFTGMVLFCMAALIFPIGFYIDEVGGQPYKLPNNTVVGSSYVLFVLSIFFTIVGLLFAGKVCLPGWLTFLFFFGKTPHLEGNSSSIESSEAVKKSSEQTEESYRCFSFWMDFPGARSSSWDNFSICGWTCRDWAGAKSCEVALGVIRPVRQVWGGEKMAAYWKPWWQWIETQGLWRDSCSIIHHLKSNDR